MRQELSKAVTDPQGRTKRRPNLSAMHQADDPAAVERRRDDALARMREVRAQLADDLADLGPADAFYGERWSAMHVMWHLGGDHTHIEDARRILAGATELEPLDDAALVRRLIANCLRNVAEWISYSERLTRDQLLVSARRANRDYYVVGMVESTAEHLYDHAMQIRAMKSRARARS